MVHIYSGILLSHKMEFESFESVLMRWMNLESIIQSEVSQKDKNTIYYHTYMESRRMALMKLLSGQQWRNRYREQTCGYEGGEDGGGEMYGESNMEIYNTICKIDSQLEYAI